MYEPKAVVYHHVLPDRISKKWLLKRAFNGGKSNAISDQLKYGTQRRSYWVSRAMGALWMAALREKRPFVKGLMNGNYVPVLVPATLAARRLGFALGSLKFAFRFT